jgi:hypothetical protein
MPAEDEAAVEESGSGLGPWQMLGAAIAGGAVLTGLAALVGAQDLTAVEWLGTTAGIAALLVAIGIYRLQERSQSAAQAELMAQLEAQAELLQQFAEQAPAEAGAEAGAPPADDLLTSEQRSEIEARFGRNSIASALDPGRGRGLGRGRGSQARLVRLQDGRLVSVYTDPRRGRIHVREVGRSR